jgi:hypothetical protein
LAGKPDTIVGNAQSIFRVYLVLCNKYEGYAQEPKQKKVASFDCLLFVYCFDMEEISFSNIVKVLNTSYICYSEAEQIRNFVWMTTEVLLTIRIFCTG